MEMPSNRYLHTTSHYHPSQKLSVVNAVVHEAISISLNYLKYNTKKAVVLFCALKESASTFSLVESIENDS